MNETARQRRKGLSRRGLCAEGSDCLRINGGGWGDWMDLVTVRGGLGGFLRAGEEDVSVEDVAGMGGLNWMDG